MEKKSLWLRIIPVFGVVIFVAILIYELFSLNLNPVETETVVEKIEQETLAVKLFVVRDEQYILKETTGTIVPLIDDGKKVAKGDTVAVVCSSANDAMIYSEIKDLQNSISRYDQLNSQQNITAPVSDRLNSDADLLFIQMLNIVSSGKFENFDSSAAAFRNKVTSQQIAINGRIDFSKKIQSLKDKLSEINNNSISVQNLIADKAGYYISSIDGYENELPYNNIEDLTASDIEQALKSKPIVVPNNALGKLVCSYNWYLLTTVNNSIATQLKIGQQKKINFGQALENSVSVKVHSINSSQNGNSAVVFVCNLMNEQLAGLRIEEAALVLKEHKGYRVNSAAVRVNKDITGAYVLLGNVISFRKFDVLYSNEEFVIAGIEENTFNTKRPYNIELFDEVVIKGKNLDEGKIVD